MPTKSELEAIFNVASRAEYDVSKYDEAYTLAITALDNLQSYDGEYQEVAANILALIGRLFFRGKGCEMDYRVAKQAFLLANKIKGENFVSNHYLKYDDPQEEWYDEGCAYCFGRGGKSMSNSEAIECWTRALSYGHHGDSYEKLAYMYRHGYGVEKSDWISLGICRFASEHGSVAATKYLNGEGRVTSAVTTATASAGIGAGYWLTATLFALNPVAGMIAGAVTAGATYTSLPDRPSTVLATKYTHDRPHGSKASSVKSKLSALEMVYDAFVSREQQVSEQVQPESCEQQVIEEVQPKKPVENRFELGRQARAVIEEAYFSNFLDACDSDGNTLLHRMAQQKLYKNYARLMFLGANQLARNSAGKLPNDYFNNNERLKVDRLLGNYSLTIRAYNTSSPDAIFSRLSCIKNFSLNNNCNVELRFLYGDEKIAPILDVVKYACYGYHRNSPARIASCEYEREYDRIKPSQLLSITINPGSHLTNNLHCQQIEGGFSGRAWRTVISIAGVHQGDYFLATLLHEFTHFVTREVFQNPSKPYRADDEVNKARFSQICDKYRQLSESEECTLPPLISDIFSFQYYIDNDQFHDELIVRMIELYFLDKKNAANQLPELWQYYNEVFLPEVVKYAEKLEKEMLHGWDPQIFKSKPSDSYSIPIPGGPIKTRSLGR